MAQNLFLEKDNPVDFLFIDRQRIASLIGQLSDKGVMTEYKDVVAQTQNREGQAGASIQVVKAETKRGRSSSESSEKTYDPFWTHVFGFVQSLEEHFAVPLEKARLGSLVKFEGFLQFIDLRLMRSLWEPSAQAFLNTGTSTLPKGHSGHKKRPEQKPQMSPAFKLGLQILAGMPHLFHMTFLTASGFRLWSAIQPENLTISGEDLTMKYGAVIDGIWTVVGIVDARSGESSEPLKLNELLDGATAAMAALRTFVGRPKDHLGLTPIAIYAPIRGLAESEVDSSESSGSNTSTQD